MKSIKGWRENTKDFLSNYTTEELNEILKKEKRTIVKNRIKACILRKEGKMLKEISKILSKPLTTIGDWLRKINNEGFEKRFSIKQKGKEKKLSKIQVTELDKILQVSPEKVGFPFKFWTNKLVQIYIMQNYKISYTIRNIQYLTKSLNYSLQKPRPRNPKANTKKQEEFIESTKKNFHIILTMDSRSFVLMKSIV